MGSKSYRGPAGTGSIERKEEEEEDHNSRGDREAGREREGREGACRIQVAVTTLSPR